MRNDDPRAVRKREAVLDAKPSDTVITREMATVLLVDDDAAVRGFVQMALVVSGYRVVVCSTGEEAVRRESEYAGPIDLVLTDIMMPGLSGIELVKHLGARRPLIKVILMSGCPADHVLRVGADAQTFIAKPFVVTTLLFKVREALGERNDPPGPSC